MASLTNGRAQPALRMSSARLALLYIALVTLLTAALLVTVYLLTRSALEREIAAVIRAEVEDLGDDLRLGGVERVAATLRLRADSWGRTGAVFLLADENFRPVAGNLSAWPRDVEPRSFDHRMVEFEITASERGAQVLHPVEARVERLANGYWLLVGADTSERQRRAAPVRPGDVLGHCPDRALRVVAGRRLRAPHARAACASTPTPARPSCTAISRSDCASTARAMNSTRWRWR